MRQRRQERVEEGLTKAEKKQIEDELDRDFTAKERELVSVFKEFRKEKQRSPRTAIRSTGKATLLTRRSQQR